MTLHCNLDEAREREVFTDFRNYLSEEEEQVLSQKFTQYVFYETWGRRDFRECICTNCGRFEMVRGEDIRDFFLHKHGDEIECPKCGEAAKLYALGRMRTGKSLEETQRAAIVRKAPDGGVQLLAGYARKQYGWNDLRPTVEWTTKVQTYLAPGVRAQRRRNTGFSPWYGCWGPGEWESSSTVREPFAPYMYTSDGGYWLIAPERLGETSLKYNQLAEWYYEETQNDLWEGDVTVRGIHRYLAAFTEFPQMEMAEKLGLHNAVTDLVYGKKNHRLLDWKAVKAADFLRMTKQDAKLFCRTGGDLELLEAYRETAREEQVTLQQFLDLASEIGGQKKLDRAHLCAQYAGVTLREAAAYIRRQTPECPRAGVGPGEILQYWMDYLDMARKLDYDLTEKTVAMPKDLQERHDNAAKMLRIRARNEEEKRLKQRTKLLKKLYEFQMGGLRVVVPESSADIIREGKTLHHCVGGYADRHVEGKVDILFLRKERTPGRSFLTIEMLPRKDKLSPVVLKQIHGYQNERYRNGEGKRPIEKYAWFLDAWMEWQRKGSRRDQKGNPILPKDKEVAV